MKRFGFVGVPFDGAATLGWPGARYAPDAVRRHLAWMTSRVECEQIYWVDHDEVIPFPAATFTDLGDVDVVPHDLAMTLSATRHKVMAAVAAGLVPLVVGGDDSILFPAVAGLHDASEGEVAVVHFDAHLDVLDESDAQGRFSQSSGMRRAVELERVRPDRSAQVGVRNFNFPSSKRWIDETGLLEIPARRVHRHGIDWVVETVMARLERTSRLFVAIDIDVLDPAYAPGVGWHEPGGLTSNQMFGLLEALAPRASGVCLNEVNPMTDHREQTAILASNLLFHAMAAAVAA